MTARRPIQGSVRALLLSLLLPLCACGGGKDAPAGDAPARVRLWELEGRLTTPADAPAETVLAEGFEARPGGWRVVTSRGTPLEVDEDALVVAPAVEGERRFLTLGGREGALYTIVPVEPFATYRFTGTLRARGVVPEAQPFFGAGFLVAELAAFGTPEEVLAGEARFLRRHVLPSAVGSPDWTRQGVAFRTGPETHGLVVGCMLTVDEPIAEGGEVDFDELGLERVAPEVWWEYEAALAVGRASRGRSVPRVPGAERVPASPVDWRGRRRVDAMLGYEQRPSMLLLPGERIELDVTVPADGPVLELSLAPWPRVHLPGPGAATLVVTVDGEELGRIEAGLDAPADGTLWTDRSFVQPDLAGRAVTLGFTLEGSQPAVVGAPLLRASPPDPGPWNVVLVSIDTLRADRVGAYGATSGATPRLDALAAESLLFTDMAANAPYTLPSHATLFSGQYPTVHGAEDQGNALDMGRSPVLASLLARHGLRTRAFTAGGFLSGDFGFHHGFDALSIRDPLRHEGAVYFAKLRESHPDQAEPREHERGLAGLERWIALHRAQPFFLFVHTFEVHDYDPPPGELPCRAEGCTSTLTEIHRLTMRDANREPFPGTPGDRAHLSHLYDAALRHVDAQVGALLDALDESGLAERTIVVVTSDHGEELFERGHLQHGKSLYAEMLRIPLIVRIPGVAPRRVTEPASLVDVAPTLLAALGLPRDPRMQGRDLLSRSHTDGVWAEVDDRRARQTALQADGWKLLHGDPEADVVFPTDFEWRLFDVTRDPGERLDLSTSEPARLAEMQRRMKALQLHLDVERASLGEVDLGAVDENTLQMLRDLGYGGEELEEERE